jgi:Ras-related protein Rab-11A
MARTPSATGQYAIKIVLVGESGVGKTNLILQFARGRFNTDSKPTIGVEFATKTLNINGETVKANIWDTAGQELFRAVTSTYYRGAQGAMLVYDITSSPSFKCIEHWLTELRSNIADPNIPIMLIGNKLDLRDQRSVPTEDGQNYAERERLLFIEGSAKTADNIEEGFTQLIAETVASSRKSDLTKAQTARPQQNLAPGVAVEKEGGCC